jgi:hypothetical protein
VTSVRPSHSGDMLRMPGRSKPVVDSGPDAPSLHGRIAGPMMPGNQQENALAARNGLLESTVDRGPRAVEIHAMEIEHPVRLDRAAPELFVPAAVEGLLSDRHRLVECRRSRGQAMRFSLWRVWSCNRPLRKFRSRWITRQRADRCCDASPQLRLLRAERAHGPPCLSAPGSKPRHWPTSRPQLQPPPSQRPSKYRSGSVP